MRTTLYLATARGLTVVTGAGENWRGEVCLEGMQLQCVAVDPDRNGIAYCGAFSNGMFRTADGGSTWSALSGFNEPNVMALASTQPGRSSIAVLEAMHGNKYVLVCPPRRDLESRW
jgi:hypothetical protein